jgi:hypothetical protein
MFQVSLTQKDQALPVDIESLLYAAQPLSYSDEEFYGTITSDREWEWGEEWRRRHARTKPRREVGYDARVSSCSSLAEQAVKQRRRQDRRGYDNIRTNRHLILVSCLVVCRPFSD